MSIDYDAFASSKGAFMDSRYNARGGNLIGDIFSREAFTPFTPTETWYATRDYPYLTRYLPITFTGQSWATVFSALGFVATAGAEGWDPAGAEWSITDGSLPPGLSLAPGPNDHSINISGTATASGSYPFTILAENGGGYGERAFPFVVLDPISIVQSADLLTALVTFTGAEGGIWDGILIPFNMTTIAPEYFANLEPDIGSSRFTISLGIETLAAGFSQILLHDTVTGGGSIIAAWARSTTAVPPVGTYAKTAGGAFWPDLLTVITV